MNPAQLLEHFDRLADTPDALPKLRKFILDLTVRGKLVVQDPKDEPASTLVKRIQAQKASLVNAGKLKKVDQYETVTQDELWCELPRGWISCRLGLITIVVMGTSPPGSSYNKNEEGIPLINGPVEFTAGPFGKTEVNQYTTEPTNYCDENDFLICVRGSTTGRTNIASFRACIGRGVAAIKPLFEDQFVRLCLCTRRESIIGMGRGIAFPSISRGQLENLGSSRIPVGEIAPFPYLKPLFS